MEPDTPSPTGLRRRRRSPQPASLWSPDGDASLSRSPSPDGGPAPTAARSTPLRAQLDPDDDDASASDASSSARSPQQHRLGARRMGAAPADAGGLPGEELGRLTAENAALRAALAEEEERNADLLALVRRADKEMQDITQRDRDLAARLAKWREEVRGTHPHSVASHSSTIVSTTSSIT
jgi:hypothetical protein